MFTKTSGTKEGIDTRTRKAAVESMTVVDLGKAKYDVYSGSKSRYTVDLIAETCDCSDEEHHSPDEGCKHRRRVEMEIGQREIPDLGRRTDVEIMSGRSRETETRVATDGGAVVSDANPQGEQDETDEDEPACLCEMVENGELGCFGHFEVSD